MRKYNFLFVLVYALFIMLPFSVNAATVNSVDEFINTLGGSEYAKIVDGEIVLEKNIKLNENISLESGTYVLDLNGKTIQDDTNVKDYIIQLNDATLTINDSIGNGTIKSTVENRTLWVESKGILNINNGNFEGYDTIISYNGSSIKINDGNFDATASAFVYYGGNVTINNGTFKSNNRTTLHLATGPDSNETLTINDGYFEGALPIYHDTGNFIINGGKFKGKNYALFINLQFISKSKINEGHFDGGIGLYQNETLYSPVITVDNGSIYELVPTLLGNDSTLSPNEYINKVDDDKNMNHELKIFKTANNVKVLKISIILDANGGKFTDSDKYIIDDIINFDYTNFNKPTRKGYKFIGFFTQITGGKSFEEVMNSEAGIEEDTTFYARWEKNSSGGVGTSEPEEENPKTFDGIGTSIFMGTISLIGLVGAIIYLRKENKVRAN